VAVTRGSTQARTRPRREPADRPAQAVVPLDAFWRAYESFRGEADPAAREAVEASKARALYIVAGPGTGKTTCLTIRILKLIFVDGVRPGRIVATTFTVKAAAELRSRILGWGFRLAEALQADPTLDPTVREQLRAVDVNQVVTGTVDSLCERILRDWRPPGVQPPVVADEFVSRTLMLREGVLGDGRYRSPSLFSALAPLRGNVTRLNTADRTDLVQEVSDRRIHDRVRWARYMRGADRPKQRLDEAIRAYDEALDSRGLVDFAKLEETALQRIERGELDNFLGEVDVLIVDEYQDTNLLQEQMYFAIAAGCGGALTVVGDDDQSLYRFRGASVELFADFADRYETRFGRKPKTVFLKTNYRSTKTLVRFVNGYATLDAGYQRVRVASKPKLDHRPNAEDGLPVLAMFRQDRPTLAHDLADFIHSVFRRSGYRLPNGEVLEAANEGGDVGDCAFLASSVREYNSGGNPRLPLLLRSELASRTPAVRVFNPRGEDVRQQELVGRIAGLLLEAIDPGAVVEAIGGNALYAARDTFTTWRTEARAYLPTAPGGLRNLVRAWAQRRPLRRGARWPRSVPVLDLLYGIVHYFPDLYDDPEGQVALEIFTRQLSAADQVGWYRGRVITDAHAQRDQWGKTRPQRSVLELLQNFLSPIASGVIGINEELVQAFPRDRLSMLTVHQAKGLEFPLVIVDVGSDFGGNYWTQAFKRFPREEGQPHRMEDTFRRFSPLKAPRRAGLDRAFDDLYRQFFVAFSRPQDALLLVGLNAARPDGRIPNVGLGWDRTGTSRWHPTAPYLEI
jgi:DNA helicase-2/ATP-dependent DNA helicase PcrA